MKYSDIDSRKTAFIFELDNVLYPEKDYLFQVYYLFASLLEYTELIDAKQTTNILTNAYIEIGKEFVFDRLKEKLNISGKFRYNLDNLLLTAKLPLKLLLYSNMLTLLQDIIVDRKTIFIVTNGKPEQQLNKIKQAEWHALEKYLTCYFAEETLAKPEPDVINQLLNEHNLQRRDIVMIGISEIDRLCAEDSGIDFIDVNNFL